MAEGCVHSRRGKGRLSQPASKREGKGKRQKKAGSGNTAFVDTLVDAVDVVKNPVYLS